MMSHYVEIQVLRDPEFPVPVLMGALFSKLHRALVISEQSNIGISFPEYSLKPRRLGSTLRLNGEVATLELLMQGNWMKGLSEYTKVTAAQPIPKPVQYCVFRRHQFKTNVERLRRRRMKRHGEGHDQAAAAIPLSVAQQPELPFATVRSQSTQQRFHLFIERSEAQPEPVPGTFNYYGLSYGATVPWF
jgi:CRISPR-associated endonuclease Csy4